MAIQGNGIFFYPLFWVWHDQWKYFYKWVYPNSTVLQEYDHYGHTHFFMLGFDWTNASQDAWSGAQRYTFRLVDLWGPASQDPNQQKQYRIVGRPKWYFHVQEVWRRIYIQPWDLRLRSIYPQNNRGLKYDCCAPDKIGGPFREGKLYTPYFQRHARTLPIDYYLDEDRSQLPGKRTNHLKDLADTVYGAEHPEYNPPYDHEAYDPAVFDLQHNDYLYAGGNLELPIQPAAKPPFHDRLYQFPTIEYQKVVQLNYERWPGWEVQNDIDSGDAGEETGEDFGDGFEAAVQIPLIDPATDRYRSPFSPAGTTEVKPIGFYYNDLVPEANRPKWPTVTYDDPENPPEGTANYYDHPNKLPPELSGQPISFWNPYSQGLTDGRWVQQCLGGIIQVKVKVITEHKLGGRQTHWVTGVQYLPATPFSPYLGGSGSGSGVDYYEDEDEYGI